MRAAAARTGRPKRRWEEEQHTTWTWVQPIRGFIKVLKIAFIFKMVFVCPLTSEHLKLWHSIKYPLSTVYLMKQFVSHKPLTCSTQRIKASFKIKLSGHVIKSCHSCLCRFGPKSFRLTCLCGIVIRGQRSVWLKKNKSISEVWGSSSSGSWMALRNI